MRVKVKRPTAKRKRPPAFRKIYFYRITVGYSDTGEALPFQVEEVMQHLDHFPFDMSGRYSPQDEGKDLSCHVDSSYPFPCLRFGTIRRIDFPSVERNGSLTPLRIADGAGLFDCIHVVFFPNNIVGAEFNFHGPRAVRLKHYLIEKARHIHRTINVAYLVKRYPWKRIDEFNDFTAFNLRVTRDTIHEIKDVDEDFFDALEKTAMMTGAEDIEISLRHKSRTKGVLTQLSKLLNSFRRVPEAISTTTKFSVFGTDGETGRVEEVDFIKEHFVIRKAIDFKDPEARELSDDAAYGAIIEAYEEFEQDLKEATSVEIVG